MIEEDARNPQNGYGRREEEWETHFRSCGDGLPFRTIGCVPAIAIRRKMDRSVALSRFAASLLAGCRRKGS